MGTRGNATFVLNVINATIGNVLSDGIISENILIHESDL